MICIKKFISIFYIFLLIILFSPGAYAATYYMANSKCSGNVGWGNGADDNPGTKAKPFETLSGAFAAMSAGDTLVIDDGIYTGSDNAMSHNLNYPPDGSDGNYTVIKAENDGQVAFDGESTRNMFAFTYTPSHSYLEFRGLKWINGTGSLVQTAYMDHIKFIRCGTAGTTGTSTGVSNWYLSRCSYILLEECYAWGTNGRYKFQAYLSDHLIFRRCIGRNDRITTTSVIGTFQNYCSQYVEFQNCIAIDCDSPEYWSGWTYLQLGYTTHRAHNEEFVENSAWRGSIALNIAGSRMFGTSDDNTNVTFENLIVWHGIDVGEEDNYTDGIEGQADTNFIFDHCTIGDLPGSGSIGVNSWNGGSSTIGVTNSIITGCSTGVSGVSPCTYNAISDNTNNISGATCTNTVTDNIMDSALKYLVRAEGNSILDGAASDGGDIGATVLTKIGVSGTLYGEEGYNTDTGESLWPFPYEDQIRSDMRAYNPGGTDSTKPDGKRGFCADRKQLNGVDDITLTSYIWEYLGNQMPAIIYKSMNWEANLRVLCHSGRIPQK